MTAPTGHLIEANVRTLFPGYFAMVMATGIIAIGADQQELHWLADGLYAVAVVAYVVLWVLLAWRLVVAPKLIAADITSHAKGFAFLTTVAATNVVGSASAVLHDWWALAWVLWWFSLGLWAFFVYATLFAVVLKGPKPGLDKGINGTWFLLTVATESIVVLGGLLLPRHAGDVLAFLLIAAFALGLVLYLIVMTMVFLRWTFAELEPTEADPPAWIAAGAVAITVLAGSNLLAARSASLRIERLAPFIEGVVMLAWATATFWFPLMVAIGIWRHIINRVPLRYHPSYWALVFPLGMYGAATFRMRVAVDLDGLAWLPKATFAVALAAWIAAFLGLVLEGARALSRRGASAAGSS
ncbi:tellurite resistance/C4-dicarboxylate transporter family protein [Aquihabitans daechungensis]|uniref:tellurite resistance/C4-dicarboxylate transporter family protein n=1 Tax=Aquihabitans daechungensis TaxID=1052257 RepID=UPI003BA2827D